MNTMNMPGFTADASLYKASERYQQGPLSAPMAFGVQAELRIGGGLNATCTSGDGKNTCVCADICAAGPNSCVCQPIPPPTGGGKPPIFA